MSVQKILAQAEKLLQKGKLQEATVKLEDVLVTDPHNEVAANKLAIAYLDLGETQKAIGLYCQIAKRASDIGKANKAIALYRQALNIDPSDPRVLHGLAEESEQLGKYSEAKRYTEDLIRYYAPRKKYLEAAQACARLVRCNPNSDEPKIRWLEFLRVLSDNSRLVPALVLLCGPPGVVAPDQSVGGDPNNLSDNLITKLVGLLRWYPNDPVLPYSLAWVFFKRENYHQSLSYLQEVLRRDPDFVLGLFLFVRILIALDRLTESQFVYLYAKDMMPKDRRTEIKVLNEQVLAFEKANGWLAITADLGEEIDIDPSTYLRLIRNEEVDTSSEGTGGFRRDGDHDGSSPTYKINEPVREEIEQSEFEATSLVRFNEIDLSAQEAVEESEARPMPPPLSMPAAPDSQQFNVAPPPLPVVPPPPLDEKLEQGMNFDLSDTSYPDEESEESEFVDETATKIYSPQDAIAATKWGKAIRGTVSKGDLQKSEPPKLDLTQFIPADSMSSETPLEIGTIAGKTRPKLGVFNNFFSTPTDTSDDHEQSEPVEDNNFELGANKDPESDPEFDSKVESEIEPATESEIESEADPDKTVMFDRTQLPTEDSLDEDALDEDATIVFQPPVEAEEAEFEASAYEEEQPIVDFGEDEDKTMIANFAADEDATLVFTPPPPPPPPPPRAIANDVTAIPPPLPDRGVPPSDENDVLNYDFAASSESELKPFSLNQSEIAARLDEKALELNGENNFPTSVVSAYSLDISPDSPVSDSLTAESESAPETIHAPESSDPQSTEDAHELTYAFETGLENEPSIPLDVSTSEGSIDRPPADGMIEASRAKAPLALKEGATKAPAEQENEREDKALRALQRAEGYLKGKKFKRARETCLEALQLGADEEEVRELRRKIREVEFPDSMYAHFSDDNSEVLNKQSVQAIIDDLDREFDLSISDEFDEDKKIIRSSLVDIRPKIKEMLAESPSEIKIDLGVAFYEMGFHEEAEFIFENITEKSGAQNLDALYLAAESMKERGNYIQAVTLLHRICQSPDRENSQNLAAYYLLGEAYEAMNQIKRSKRYYKKAANIDKNYRSVRTKLE